MGLVKLHLLSDLHLETGAYRLPEGLECDVIVAVGDIGLGTAGVEFLKTLPRPVLYVPGNHEFWPVGATETDDSETPAREDYDKRLERICAAAAGSNVNVLDCDAVVIDGVRFLGTTLWTDYGRGNPWLMQSALRRMRDCYRIGAAHWYATEPQRETACHFLARMGADGPLIAHRMDEKLFLPIHAHALHRKALRFLRRELAKPFAGETVVLTHHAPTFEALRRSGIALHYLERKSWTANEVFDEESLLYRVAAYASDLDVLLAQYSDRINLWCFGHIHHALDFVHEGVRLASNPRGYYRGPLTAKSARAFAFFGVPVSEDDIARSQAHFRAHPYQGDGVGFEPGLVIDTGAGLAPPLARRIDQALAAVRPSREELEQFAGHVFDRDIVIRKACQEAVLTRARQITDGLRPAALEALRAIGLGNRYDSSGTWALSLAGLEALMPNSFWSFEFSFGQQGVQHTRAVLADIRRGLAATERRMHELPGLPERAHRAVRRALTTIMRELEAQGVEVAVRGWATRKHVRRLPSNYWAAYLRIGQAKLGHSSELGQPESGQTDTAADPEDAIRSSIQIRFFDLIDARREGWRKQLQIAVYDADGGSGDSTEHWMTAAEFRGR